MRNLKVSLNWGKQQDLLKTIQKNELILIIKMFNFSLSSVLNILLKKN